MLAPLTNGYRGATRLPDIWEFRFDPDDVGQAQGWHAGFDQGRPIAVPASWNDIFAEGGDSLGPGWYQVWFHAAGSGPGIRTSLRFDSVSYFAEVWVNGEPVGTHAGAHLPFELDCDGPLMPGENLLVVRVDGRLSPATVPAASRRRSRGFGAAAGSMFDVLGGMLGSAPPTNFDFFPYAGIQRPVWLVSRPAAGLVSLRADTTMHGVAELTVGAMGDVDAIDASITRGDIEVTTGLELAAGRATGVLGIDDAACWGIGAPNLYRLEARAIRGGTVVDAYSLDIGFRTMAVDGTRLLLNGEPVELRGFGRHEDFPIHGRGYDPAVMVKDFSLMAWCGANSFRTSHYPYAEEQLTMADRLGVLVISESPAVSFRFDDDDDLDARLTQWRRDLDELVARDRNHPSVVMWSVGNEPMDFEPGAAPIITEMIDRVRTLDPHRPVFVDSPLSHTVECHESSDIVGLHAYPGWYSDQGDLEVGIAHTRDSIAELAKLGKPIVITEIGADTIAGHHAQPPEMFSEEYQAELVERVLDLVEDVEELAGVHWWNLCDFKTGQGIIRPKALNHKGLFTRDRRPKMAAHRIRARWAPDRYT